MIGWPSGVRRQFQVLISLEAWVRVPLQPYSFYCDFCLLFVRLCRRATRSIDQVVHFQGWMAEWSSQFKALVSSEAWIRIPLQSYIPVSLVGQETRLSPARPGFNSRTGIFFAVQRKLGQIL